LLFTVLFFALDKSKDPSGFAARPPALTVRNEAALAGTSKERAQTTTIVKRMAALLAPVPHNGYRFETQEHAPQQVSGRDRIRYIVAANDHRAKSKIDQQPMVVLNRIYTRAGDDGTTSLGTGERRKKYDLRIAAYGTLDEVNAVIGIARLHTAGDPGFDALLGRVQNDLFDVEADLCLPGKGKGPGGARLNVTEAQVTWLEQEIDRLNAELEPLKSFVLPGGTPGAAYLHLARTVCRRAERIMVELKDRPGESVTPEALKYVNRLSDFLFVASRWLNDRGSRDVLWAPGQHR
jgi:cob(I)alamin adenosyltransferase